MALDPTLVAGAAALTKLQADLEDALAMTKIVGNVFKTPTPPTPDTTPPSDVTGATATLSNNIPQLSCTPATDNVRVAGYQWYFAATSGGVYTAFPSTTPSGAFIDTTATSGVQRFYKVKAFDTAFPPNFSVNFSNIVNATPASQDVTAPNIPGVPTLVSQNNNNVPPTAIVSVSPVTDIDPGTGAPVTGTSGYNFKTGTVVDPNSVANSATIGSAVTRIIGTNNGGSIVTFSDSGTVLTGTSATNDLAAQHWSTIDEYGAKGSLVQGLGWHARHVTARTNGTGFNKDGIELRDDDSPGAQYFAFTDFGPTNGLKTEFRQAQGAQATGTATTAHPGYPYWQRQRWTNNWDCINEYSTDSTNPDPVSGNGTWHSIGEQIMGFANPVYANKYIDCNTFGGTGITVTSTYDQYILSGTGPIIYNVTGTAGATVPVSAQSFDFALNASAFGTALGIVFPATPQTARPWPMYGSHCIGDGDTTYRYDNSSFQAYGARNHRNICGFLAGTDVSGAQTIKTICTNIHNLSSIGSRIAGYIDVFFETSQAESSFISATSANHFVLYSQGGGGFPAHTTPVTPNGAGSFVVNVTLGGPTESHGWNTPTYLANYINNRYFNGNAQGLVGVAQIANTALDEIYLDDVQGTVPGGAAGDWSRTNGSQDYSWPNGVTTLALQQGWVAIFHALKTLQPNIPIGANGGGSANINGIGAVTPAAYAGLWDGTNIFENAIGGGAGSPSNPGNGGSFASMKQAYQAKAATLASNGILMVLGNNVRADGSAAQSISSANVVTWSPANQGVREQWAMCMVLGNGAYFCGFGDPFNSGGQGAPYSSRATNRREFDWFYINPATGAVIAVASQPGVGNNWMGAPIDPVQTSPWQNLGPLGVWKREFTNCIVTYNPYGNGIQTNVNLGGTYKFPSGSTDPTYNGATGITTRTHQNGDGYIFLK